MKRIKSNSIDLVLTDPPYAMTTTVTKKNEEITAWDKHRNNRNEWENWDKLFTMEQLDAFILSFYQKLRIGGTLIMFCDLWKIGTVKKKLERRGFKQIRMIEWIKTNPQPRHCRITYLSNVREVALVAVKGSSSLRTFNSHYDNGIYHYATQVKNRTHPTQKSLKLFEELILKHSDEGDVVLDTFLGSGTTLIACEKHNRVCFGCEINEAYFSDILDLI
jgi:site-specific DNA-methyltransferase (adenine-specific)